MATLVSPGVSVSVIDESFYVSSGPGTVPLILVATQTGKLDSSGTATAEGTLKENAGKLYLMTSQRELLTTFGTPNFISVGGTQQHGNELNEYGLLAAHSYLGIANRAYVVRADIDLGELEPLDEEPVADPDNGSYWMDLNETTFGLFKWNSVLAEWEAKEVKFLTDATYLNGSYVPLPSYPGVVGSYVMVVGDADPAAGGRAENRIYRRDVSTWVLLDSSVISTNVIFRSHTRIPTTSEVLDISITLGGTGYAVDDVITLVGSNAAGTGAKVKVTSVSVGVITGIELIATGTGYTVTTLAQASTTGTGTGATFGGTLLVNGDYWVKTTSPNGGTSVSLKQFDETTSQFVEVDAPLAISRDSALLSYGNNPQAGDIFVHYDYENESYAVGNSIAEFSIMSHNGNGDVVATGSVEAPTLTPAEILKINGTNVTVPGTPTLANFVAAITNADIDDITAEIVTGNKIRITNTAGKDIVLINASGGVIEDLGLTSNISVTNGYVHSNWSQIAYTASLEQPSAVPAAGRLWYNTDLQVDILVNNGLGQWDEFTGTVYLQPAEPTSPVTGDIWIDSDQIEDYPVISVYDGSDWVQTDTSDQTSPDGIVFADARPTPTFGADLGENNGGETGYPDLDADAPDPLLYPAGMMLWNTRYSTYNVKEWTPDYTFNGVVVGDRWVTKSGNASDGSPLMGRKAQRAVIVAAMAASIADNEDIRAESIFFNLMAAPAYPEMIDDLVSLNVDRKETGFIIADAPMRLAATGTTIMEWAQNSNGAASNGEKGLLTANTYLGVYYPGIAYTTNLDGAEVCQPPSHIALRTMAYNDQVSYQWFAPAGYQRGIVTNAVSVGYLNGEDEFVPVELSEGLRDVLQTNNINPIAQRPNRGLVVFGQKTRHPVASALDRINVARLINYIRYQAPLIAEPFLFEPNDTLTRRAVKNAMDRFLENLIVLRGLYGFLVVCDESNNTPVRIDRNELWIDVLIQPTKAVEFIYIPVRVRNTGSELSL